MKNIGAKKVSLNRKNKREKGIKQKLLRNWNIPIIIKETKLPGSIIGCC